MNHKQGSVKDPVRVLFLAAEAEPLIKVGGLGDVAGSLPPALNRLDPAEFADRGFDVRLVLPLHPAIWEKYGNRLQPASTVSVQHQSGPLEARIYSLELAGVRVYLVAGSPVPEQGLVYSMDAVADGKKFTFTSLAALEIARMLDWRPDILHANDWHTSMAVYALAGLYADDPFFSQTRTLLSVHNLPFLGVGAQGALPPFGLHPTTDKRLPEWARGMPLPLGLLTADKIVPVSPRYAQEILTPEYGSGLETFLQSRQDVIVGVLNGIDTTVWNPLNDNALAVPFSLSQLAERQTNKTALQNEFDLDVDPSIPLLTFIGRMDPQKGFDLAVEGLALLGERPWQAIILGTGVAQLEQAAHDLQAHFPNRVRSLLRFDARLAHQLYGGGDILLMPSRYEPCGLAQMIAMRYGCIPYARTTGGLVDTIKNQFTRVDGTGFLFHETTPDSFASGLSHVLDHFQDRNTWLAMQRRAMDQDFSWEHSARDYAQIYFDLMDQVL